MHRKKLIPLVGMLVLVVIAGAIAIRHDESVKADKALEIAQEYLAEKYEQEMIYERMRFGGGDSGVYRISFISQDTAVEFEVTVSPHLFEYPEEKTSPYYLRDNYLSSFFCRTTEKLMLPEITAIWDDSTSIYVTIYPNDAYYEKKFPDTNIHMTEREMESFYEYGFGVRTNQILNSESKIEEAERILRLLQAFQQLGYQPVEVTVWYQTGEGRMYINFVDGSAPHQSEKLENWTRIETIEDVVKVMDEQWFNH